MAGRHGNGACSNHHFRTRGPTKRSRHPDEHRARLDAIEARYNQDIGSIAKIVSSLDARIDAHFDIFAEFIFQIQSNNKEDIKDFAAALRQMETDPYDHPAVSREIKRFRERIETVLPS